MKKYCVILLGVFCFTILQPNISSAVLITSAGDASLANGNMTDFNGIYVAGHDIRTASVTVDGVTFSGNNDIELEYFPYANVVDGGHLGNGFNLGFYSGSIRFDFSQNIEAFAFLLGASNNTWTLTAYDASDVQLDQQSLAATGGDSSLYYGIHTPGSKIAYAILSDTSGSDLIFLDNFITGPVTASPGGSVKIYNIEDAGTYDYYWDPANWDRADRGGEHSISIGFNPGGDSSPNDTGEYQAFIKANLAGVSSSNITKAELNLYMAGSSNPNAAYPISLHKITSLWLAGTEKTAAGGGANPALPFPDPGGIVTAENMPPYDAELMNFFPPGATPLWVTIDITTLVQAWLAIPGDNHGIMMRQQGTSPYDNVYRYFSFRSSDWALPVDDGAQPYLEIFYAGGTDTDGDGVIDADDNCPAIKNAGQEDNDGDGIGNACDNCPSVSSTSQTDSDADGYGNVCDSCPEVADDQSDKDNDGVGDACDNCELFYNSTQADADADGLGDKCDVCPNDADNNIDGDIVCGDADNCPEIANSDQADDDGDGIGDVCDECPGDAGNDSDADGICDAADQCPGSDDSVDTDGDGIADGCDTCPTDANNDADSDGVCGDSDNCPSTNNPTQADADSDGFGDVCDVCPNDADNDTDNDGVCGDADGCPDDINKTAPGTCGCGEEDVDSDSDGTLDCDDGCPTDPDKTEPGANGCETPEDFVFPGSNRNVTPFSGLFINFGQVIGGGKINFFEVFGAQPPSGNRFVGPVYDVDFTGSFTGPATLCFDYDESKVKKAENMLRLMHRKAGQSWGNITKNVDTDNNSICGETSSFSEFAVVEEASSSSSSGCFITTATYDSGQGSLIGLAPIAGFSWLAVNFGAAMAFMVFFSLFALMAGLTGAIFYSKKE